jgi:Ca2+-transporting ATPase
MAIRSETMSLVRLGLASNSMLLGAVVASVALHLMLVYVPALQLVFGTEPLPANALAIAAALAFAVMVGVEIEKWAARRGWLYDLRLPVERQRAAEEPRV